MNQLCIAFNKLRELRVRGIFVEFDISWTSAFLVAAPSLEVLQIEVMQLSPFFLLNYVIFLFSPHLELLFFTSFAGVGTSM
jgi:hypothetical protein